MIIINNIYVFNLHNIYIYIYILIIYIVIYNNYIYIEYNYNICRLSYYLQYQDNNSRHIADIST